MRASTSLICLVLLLSAVVSQGASTILETESPTLNDDLSKIDEGLRMIEQPLSVIGDYYANERRALEQEKLERQQESERLQRESDSLASREQALTWRAKALDEQESGLLDMWLDLDKVTRDLKRARTIGVVVIVLALVGGGVAGYFIGHH